LNSSLWQLLKLASSFFGQFGLLFYMVKSTQTALQSNHFSQERRVVAVGESNNPLWRQAHLGHWMSQALKRFDARVMFLMSCNEEVPLALSNLAARGCLSASHIHITRHLALEGSRLTELATLANVSKQAMGKLVEQCEAWGLVTRLADPRDARARRIVFTSVGRSWLNAFSQAVAQAEAELRAAVGADVATVIAIGLEAYAA
jgi:DNA-binding MarR family transcriptional regulator